MTVLQYFVVQTMYSTYVPNNRGAQIIGYLVLISRELFKIYLSENKVRVGRKKFPQKNNRAVRLLGSY